MVGHVSNLDTRDNAWSNPRDDENRSKTNLAGKLVGGFSVINLNVVSPKPERNLPEKDAKIILTGLISLQCL
ncbi:MAG: hypothetical protein ACJAXZ_002940 [Akkermansiaceae bacterium]|jgi:hypothetical protein